VLRDVIITSDRGGPNGSVLVVRVSGRLDAYNYTELGETLQQAIDSGERMIVLDLSRLAFIDHTGLGVLVRTTTQLEKLKGQIRLAGVRKKLREAFSLSRLDVMFHGKIAQDEAAAIADMCRQSSGKRFRNPFKR
jgi:anti-sigma B factor antagonist